MVGIDEVFYCMPIPTITIGKKPTYRKVAEDLDFYQIFRAIEQEFETCFLLESLHDDASFSRYASIGFAPRHSITGSRGVLTIDGTDYPTQNPFHELERIVPTDNISRKYAGGLVGSISYGAIELFEPVLSLHQDEQFPLFQFGVYTDGLVYDKITGEVYYFCYDDDRFSQIEPYLSPSVATDELVIRDIHDSHSKQAHARMVSQTIEEIKAGNTFQCQIGLRRSFSLEGNPIRLYETLRQINPSPFMFYLKFGAQQLIGASPELLFTMGDRVMQTYPLAGTIRRGTDAEEDTKLARTLLRDPKEIAEHNMLVDLHRNDIGRVASFGTVKIQKLLDIKRFSHVQHISSEITGIARSDVSMFEALAANFPAGTLTGAPKIETVKIIDRIEQQARGPYGGAVGHFGFNGNATFTIPIRSIFIHGTNGYTQASSGIVYDSKPENEYDEVQRKLAATTQVLHQFVTTSS